MPGSDPFLPCRSPAPLGHPMSDGSDLTQAPATVCHKLPSPLPPIYHYSPIPHKPFGIRNSEIRNANALIPHHGAGSSGPIIRGCEWSGRMERFRPFDFQPRRPRFRNLMRKNPSDALATPFRSIARHPHSSTQPPLRTSHFQVSQSGIGGSQKWPPSAGRLKTPPQRLGDAIFDSLLREY